MKVEKDLKIAFVVAAPITASVFLKPHIEKVSNKYEIDIIGNFEKTAPIVGNGQILSIPIKRNISVLHDFKVLIKLIRLFREKEYDAIISVSPKAGLLAMTAAWVAQIGVRIHWYTGQVWITKIGLTRLLLKTSDRIVGKLSTDVLVDSPSQRQFLIDQNLINSGKSSVLGLGSICGIDILRFRPNEIARNRIRSELGIRDEECVYLYLGRVTKDKGILDLVEAYCALNPRIERHLIIAGPDEEDLVEGISQELTASGLPFSILGFVENAEALMCASDIFCLPSYREGFGQAVIEAGSCAVPAIASAIYGLTDAVQDGVTGMLFRPRDVTDLALKMTYLAEKPDYRANLGVASRERVLDNFTQEIIVNLFDEYLAVKLDTKK
jgi:glycosyltransferase involved in cell wall biosynthesis